MALDRLKFGVMYRVGFTPWDGHKLPSDLTKLIEGGARLPASKALDLGCGTGDISIYLARHGWEVRAVDFVKRALDRARAKAAAADVKVEFVQADVTRLSGDSLGTGFQLVVDGGCLHGLDNSGREAYARVLNEVTAPGARLILAAFPEGQARGVRGISQPEVERRFTPGWALLAGGVDAELSNDPGYPLYVYDLQRR